MSAGNRAVVGTFNRIFAPGQDFLKHKIRMAGARRNVDEAAYRRDCRSSWPSKSPPMSAVRLRRAKPTRDDFLSRPRRPITVVLDGVDQNFSSAAAGDLWHETPIEQTQARTSGPRHSIRGAMTRAPARKPSHRRCEGPRCLGHRCRTDSPRLRSPDVHGGRPDHRLRAMIAQPKQPVQANRQSCYSGVW
jgi:hypothetical protein